MIERILHFLNGNGTTLALERPDELQVAVAALLVEAARMDDRFAPEERAAIAKVLAERFALAAEDTSRLLAAALKVETQSAQLFRFTHLVVERLAPPERVRIIEMLWEVVYAEGRLDPDADALVRQIAGLIYVSDHDRGEARRRVLERLGLNEE